MDFSAAARGLRIVTLLQPDVVPASRAAAALVIAARFGIAVAAVASCAVRPQHHLFPEPGALAGGIAEAAGWFSTYLT